MPENRPASSNRAVVVVAAVIGVLVVVLGLVLAQTLTSDDDPVAPAAESPPQTVATPAAGECEEPPPVPESPEQYDEVPDASLAEDAVWIARVITNCGEIVMELAGDKAPQTVSSFLFLAEENFWDDSPCHRLVTEGIFVLQCGDPTGTGSGGPTYSYTSEPASVAALGPAPDGASAIYPRGSVAMAQGGQPPTIGSQFFIAFQDTQLPPDYTLVGTITMGIEVIDAVAAAGNDGSFEPSPGGGAPVLPITLTTVTVAAPVA